MAHEHNKSQNKDGVLRAKLAVKTAALLQCEEKILHLTDEIKAKATSLRQQRVSEKSVRVANSRLVSKTKQYATDLKNRPPDRGDDIRQYTKMDLDVWAYPHVREWFNKLAPTDEGGGSCSNLAPWQTGYTILIDRQTTQEN